MQEALHDAWGKTALEMLLLNDSETKVRVLRKKFFSGLGLETRSNASFMCKPAFMAGSSLGFLEANENKWKPPIKAVSNGVNIKYT